MPSERAATLTVSVTRLWPRIEVTCGDWFFHLFVYRAMCRGGRFPNGQVHTVIFARIFGRYFFWENKPFRRSV